MNDNRWDREVEKIIAITQVLGEIDAHKERIARKIGIAPLHHLGHTPSHDDYVDKIHRLIAHMKVINTHLPNDDTKNAKSDVFKEISSSSTNSYE